VRPRIRFLAAIAASMCGLASAQAEPATEFYKGKQIKLIVAHSVGGDYDLGARLLAKYLVKYIPGHPTIIVQNMPAGGGIVAANYLYSQAPRDGTVMGSFSRNLPSQALMRQVRIDADPRRFNYLGATSLPSRVCLGRSSARVQTINDLFKYELIVGAVSGTSLAGIPRVLNHVLNTKFKVIEGYRGPNDVVIAMERGEVEGICSAYAQFRANDQVIRDGKARILLRAEETPVTELSHVPSVYDYAKTDEQRSFLRFVLSTTEFGRPYVMPPDVPVEALAIMRKAMAAAVADRSLVSDSDKMKLDMTYTSPEQLENLLNRLYSTSPTMIEAVKQLGLNL